MSDPTIGNADIRIGADATPFNRELASATSSAAPGIGSKMSSLLGGALTIGARVTGVAVAAALGGTLLKGFERLSAIDDAKGKLAGLGHSAKEVAAIMDNALASVKGTAFGLGEAATSAANLVAAGVKPGKDLTHTLKLMADTATIAGTSMSEVGYQFQQVAASGKLTGQNLASLTDRGIPVLQFLAKSLHTTTAKAQEMTSKGKVSFKQFEIAMTSGVGGAALAGGKTVSGAMKNVSAALSRVGAGLLGGVFSQLPGLFAKLIGWLDKITPVAKTVGAAIGTAFSKGFAALLKLFSNPILRKVFTELVGGVRALVESFKAGGNDITSSGFAGIMEHIGLTARAVFDWVANVAVPAVKSIITAFRDLASGFTVGTDAVGSTQSVFATLGSVIADRIMPAFDSLKTALAALVGPAMDTLNSSTSSGVSIMQTFGDLLVTTVIPALASIVAALLNTVTFFLQHQNAAKALGAVLVVVFAAMVTGWVASAVAATSNTALIVNAWFATALAAQFGAEAVEKTVAQTLVGWVVMAARAMWGALQVAASWVVAMGPIGWAIAAVVGLGILIYLNFDRIKKWIGAAWDWIKTKTVAAWGAILSFFTRVWAAITSGVSTAWAAVVSFVSGVWKSITSGVSTAWAAVVSFFTGIWTSITDFVAKVVSVGAKILNAITYPYRVAVAIVVGLIMILVGAIWPPIKSFINDVVRGFGVMWAFVVATFNGIKNFIIGVWNAVVAFVVPIVTRLVKGLIKEFNWAKATVTLIFLTVKNFLVGTWNSIYAYVSGVVQRVWSFVVERFNLIKNTIATVMSAVSTTVSQVWRAIWTTVSGFVGKVWANITGTFNRIVTFISTAVGRAKKAAGDFIGGVWKAIKDKIKDFATMGKDIIAGLIKGITSTGAQLWTAVKKFIQDHVPAPVIKLLQLGSPSKLFEKFGGNTAQGLVNGLLGGSKKVAQAAQKMTAPLSTNPIALPASASRSVSSGMTPELMQLLLAKAKPDVKFEQTFNEKVNPHLLSKEIAWALR